MRRRDYPDAEAARADALALARAMAAKCALFELPVSGAKLVLFETDNVSDRLNHLGFEVFDDQQVDAAATRLAQAGIENEVQQSETCCFAKQNKVITHDPDGTMWEGYRVLEDSPSFFAEPVTEPAARPACCA